VANDLDPVSFSRSIRRLVLEQSKRANIGHIGSALCIADILAVLYCGGLSVSAKEPRAADRDRFILSKGHAALGLYAALFLSGFITREQLETFCGDLSRLGVHPERALPGVDFCSGSLGQGLSLAVGAALAARMQGSKRRIFCLLSDAECEEGSVWEAIMFAAHHGLGNLTAIVDQNGQQAFGATRDILRQENLAERWRAFGWKTLEVDGHDHAALRRGLAACSDGPTVLVANTVFAKGVSFMETGHSPSRPNVARNPINWHYLPMSDQEYEAALRELGSST
jgi:transketolase